MAIIFNLILSAVIIAIALWVAQKNPTLGGFIVSLPLSTLIILAFSKLQHNDVGNTFVLAKSIFIGVPSTLVFFIPFLLADKFKISFWACYASGLALLSVSYVIHKSVVGYLIK